MASEKIRVAVIMGGMSGEHEVSVNSGSGVLANLDTDRYRGRKVLIQRDGNWSVDDAPATPMLAALQVLQPDIDVAFLALHGPNGEDGTMQSLFHLLGIPYTGSDYYASSLAMNKPRAKDVFAQNGLTVAPHRVLDSGDLHGDPAGIAREVAAELGLPAVVKTTKLGSSVGVDIARTQADLARLLADFLQYGAQVMVEQFVQGTEVTAPVIDDPDSGETRALPLIEIRPAVAGWFDYRAKYEIGGAEEICPAPIPADLTARCQRIGLQAHKLLGCRGMSRTDIIIAPNATCHVIETNTIPGFTQTSLLPQAAAAAGYSYAKLVDMLIREALHRHRGESPAALPEKG